VIGSIVALLDGELADAERLGVEEHLARCATCARDLNELRSTRRIVTAHLVAIGEQVSEPRFETVWTRVARESSRQPGVSHSDGTPPRAVLRALPKRRRWLWAGASAGLALAAGVAALVLAPRLIESSPATRGVSGTGAPAPVVAALPAAPEPANKPAKAPTRLAKASQHGGEAAKQELARRPQVAAPGEPTPAEAPAEEAVAVNELDPPRDLLERPDLFLNYPIVRKLDELRNLDAVLAGQGADEQPDDGGAG
jgi:hypothetical protein